MIPDDEIANYEAFRDCLSDLVISKLSPSADKAKKKRAVKGRKNEIKPVVRPAEEVAASDAADLGEFIDVCTRPMMHILAAATNAIDSISPLRFFFPFPPTCALCPTARYRTMAIWPTSTAFRSTPPSTSPS